MTTAKKKIHRKTKKKLDDYKIVFRCLWYIGTAIGRLDPLYMCVLCVCVGLNVIIGQTGNKFIYPPQ